MRDLLAAVKGGAAAANAAPSAQGAKRSADAPAPAAAADAGGAKKHAAPEASSILVSAKEEKDLEELLELFAMGIGDVDIFQKRCATTAAAAAAAFVI